MTAFAFQQLDIYRLAMELAVDVHKMTIRDAEIRDQATRAAKSCFLNIAEGLPSYQSGVRRRHFSIARGSLGELAAAIDLGQALGLVEEAELTNDKIQRVAQLLNGFRHL
ncbi:MAG TPA: four helix bundle protein [Polyangiaceae bacterium]